MKPLLTTIAVLAAAGGYGLKRRHGRLTDVAPDLRHPQLYIPMSIRDDTTLRMGRKMMAAMPAGAVADGVEVRTESIPTDDGPTIDLVIYEPGERSAPSGALLWIHGGGLVMGNAELGNALCSRFAAELGMLVVSVDYRLAPEHAFPAGLHDCFDALSWLHDHSEALGVDTDRIAVGGDSAGGGLAACLAQLAHDRGGPEICFQLLQYPMLDDRTPLRDDLTSILWTTTSNQFAWTAYLGHPPSEDESRPYASAARRADLAGLPPAWVGVGGIDLFHDECVDYVHRLRDAGVEVELHVEPGMYHAAEQLAPTAPAMVDFRNRMVDALGNGVSASRL